MSHLDQKPAAHPPVSALAGTSLFCMNDRSPEQVSAWNRDVLRAREDLGARRFEDGITLTTACLNSAQKLFADPKPQLIACNVLLGQLYYESQQYTLALRAFSTALTLCESDRAYEHTTLTILGNIAASHIQLSNPHEAIATYEKRLSLLDCMLHASTSDNSTIQDQKTTTLEELSALCFKTGNLDAAERFSYALATMQTCSIERGKTLVLLARIFSAGEAVDLALRTAAMAQKVLRDSDAEYKEPLALATAYRLEASLLLSQKSFERARACYVASHAILRRTPGPQHLNTLLCRCDIATMDVLLENDVKAVATFTTVLPQAEKLLPNGSNHPLLRPYIWSSACAEHNIGIQLLMARSAIKAMPKNDVTLISVNQALEKAKLEPAWDLIFQKFNQNVERRSLLAFLKQTSAEYLDSALDRYMQVIASLQRQRKTKISLGIAAVYDRMSSLCFSKCDNEWGYHYQKQAAIIRDHHLKSPGGNQL